MSSCPECGNETNEASKEWNYHLFHVKNLVCRNCGISFMAYYRNGKLSHIIAHTREPQRGILKYLREHKIAKIEEIADALHIDEITVLNNLVKMEKNGSVEQYHESKNSK